MKAVFNAHTVFIFFQKYRILESLPKHGANILDIPDRKLHIFSEVVMISKFYEPNEVYELTESDEDIDVKWICSTQVFDYRYVRLKRKYYIFVWCIVWFSVHYTAAT